MKDFTTGGYCPNCLATKANCKCGGFGLPSEVQSRLNYKQPIFYKILNFIGAAIAIFIHISLCVEVFTNYTKCDALIWGCLLLYLPIMVWIDRAAESLF